MPSLPMLLNSARRTAGRAPQLSRAAYKLLRYDREHWRYAGLYLNSFRTKYLSVHTETPILTLGAVAFLDDYLDGRQQVFEWGAGGSTAYIARRCASLVYVENIPDYYAQVAEHVEHIAQGEVSGLLVESERDATPPDTPVEWASYRDDDPRFADETFIAYAQAIDAYPDQSFDLVNIDGRARSTCVYHALPKIRDGGYLMLDDSHRPGQIAAAVAYLNTHYPAEHLHGARPYHTYELTQPGLWTTTSIWRIQHT